MPRGPRRDQSGLVLGRHSSPNSNLERAPVDDWLRAAIYRQLGFAQDVEMVLEGVCLCLAKHGAGDYQEVQRRKLDLIQNVGPEPDEQHSNRVILKPFGQLGDEQQLRVDELD